MRKQLYIEDVHEQLLKQRAAERGVSEARLVREALDMALRETTIAPPTGAMSAFAEFTGSARRLAKRRQLPGGRVDREAIYGERLTR